MNVLSIRTARGVFSLALICSSLAVAQTQTATSRIVSAAKGFLATLDQKQRQSVLFAFDDEKQRARWSNLPTGFVPRGGISLKEMSPVQRSAAMALVSSALSPKGFEKVQQIMEGDEVNKINEANRPGMGILATLPILLQIRMAMGRLPGMAGIDRRSVVAFPLIYLGRIFTTSRSSELLLKKIRGCCSLAATIWRSTSPSPANVEFSPRR